MVIVVPQPHGDPTAQLQGLLRDGGRQHMTTLHRRPLTHRNQSYNRCTTNDDGAESVFCRF